jgi:integrase
MAEISQILGHTSIEMTMRYIGVDKTSIVRAANVLDARHAARTAELVQRDAAMAVN